MENLVEELGDDFIFNIDRDALTKTCRVYLQDAEDNKAFGWALSRCIVWEQEKNGSKYILSEGTWYKVDTDFFASATNHQIALRNIPLTLQANRQYLIDDGCPQNSIPEPFQPQEYSIVFASIIGQTQREDIPFLSKVSFRDVALNLGDLGFGCFFVL